MQKISLLKKEAFINSVSEKFDIFIFATKKNLTDKKELLSNFYGENNAFTIQGFTMKQRRELVDKYMSIKGINDVDEMNKIHSAVEGAVSACSILDMSDPGYLILLINQIVGRKLYIERDTHDAFSIIFETSINNSIIQASGKEDADAYDWIFSRLAFDMTFLKHSIYFDQNLLAQVVKFGSEHFTHLKKIDSFEAINVLLDSKLIKKSGHLFQFRRNSFLAYFASKEVVRLFRKGENKYINEITNNITYGINGDVLIFVAYQLRETRLFYQIQDTLMSLLNKFDTLSFESKNNPILKANKKLIPESKEQAENRKDFYKRIESGERKAIGKAEHQEEQVYNQSVNDESRAILKVLKLIEISCKAIAGFPNDIEMEDRTLLLDTTLDSALKIINMIFQFEDEKEIEEIEESFNKSKQQFIKELENKNADIKIINKVQELDIVHAFYNVLTTYLLNLETGMARIASSKVSIPIIAKLDNNIFSRLLFKLIAYEEIANIDGFINCLRIVKEKNNREYSLIANRVVRVFMIKHDVTSRKVKEISSITNIPPITLLSYANKNK